MLSVVVRMRACEAVILVFVLVLVIVVVMRLVNLLSLFLVLLLNGLSVQCEVATTF